MAKPLRVPPVLAPASLRVPAGIAVQALNTLRNIASAPFPATEAFAIWKLISRLQLNPDVMAADATRLKLIAKHGETDGINTTVPPKNMEAFGKEYRPVAETVVDLGDIRQLPFSILEHAPPMSPIEMMALEAFFTEVRPADKEPK